MSSINEKNTRKFIEKDGVKYFEQWKLRTPRRDDFFVETGEVEFGGRYEPTGYFDDALFNDVKRIYNANFIKKCENKAGYYCKLERCTFPKCVNQ